MKRIIKEVKEVSAKFMFLVFVITWALTSGELATYALLFLLSLKVTMLRAGKEG